MAATNPRILGVIPARYDDARFPGKLLAKLNGKPVMQWVYEAAGDCPDFTKIVVGTDDERIREAAQAMGAEVLMTGEHHRTSMDRVAEVAETYDDFDLIVNLHGDQPGLQPGLISELTRLKIEHPEWQVVTLARAAAPSEELLGPNHVKIALSKKNRALYFSRSLIPFPRNPGEQPVHVHIGVYVCDREFLMRYRTLPQSGLEASEALEQLRILENDFSIGVHVIDTPMPSVNAPEDIGAAAAVLTRRKAESR